MDVNAYCRGIRFHARAEGTCKIRRYAGKKVKKIVRRGCTSIDGILHQDVDQTIEPEKCKVVSNISTYVIRRKTTRIIYLGSPDRVLDNERQSEPAIRMSETTSPVSAM